MVPGVAVRPCVVGVRQEHFVRNIVGEKKLRHKVVSELAVRIEAHPEMNMNRAAPVPPGVDGQKTDIAMPIGHLISAQKILSLAVLLPDGRVDAQAITVPDIHLSAAHGADRAVGQSRDIDRQLQLEARLDGTGR